ncbi:hypothetical protein LBMAG42_37690 [Deltaproteobacteria bacterium]|nr:hypothetical protein LBMAG42_37690 [Deltaproteobacteria bacterium]
MPIDALAPAFRVWLDGGVVGAVGAGNVPTVEGAPGITGSIGMAFGADPSRNFGLLLQERELVMNLDERHVSSIGVLVRYPADDGPYALLGGIHNHELPLSTWLDDPGGAIAATRPDITHRTGIEFGGGWDFAPAAPDSQVARMFRPTLQVSAGVLPGTDGALVYGMLRASMRLGLVEIKPG